MVDQKTETTMQSEQQRDCLDISVISPLILSILLEVCLSLLALQAP